MKTRKLSLFDRVLGLLGTPIADLWRRFLAWLRTPRLPKSGTLPPVVVTHQGDVVSSVERVPIRSTKADAKRAALSWARNHWKDPTLTWGQARKRIKRLEARMRDGHLDAGAVAALDAVKENE